MSMMGGMGFARGLAMGGGTPGMGGGGQNQRGLATSEEDFGRAFDPRVIGRLWRYASPFKGRIAIGIVLLLINTGTAVLGPLIPGLAVNYIHDQNTNGLYWICGLFMVNNTVQWLSQYQQVYQMTWVGQHALYRVASDMFSHIASLSLSFFDQNETGRVMARMQNDVNVLQQMLSNGMIAIFGSMLSLVGFLGILFVLNWRLAALVSISVPIMSATIWIWQRYARRSFLRARATISAVNSSIQENVSGVRVIQSLSRESINSRQFRDVNAQNMRASVEAGQASALVQPMVELIGAATLAVAIFVGGNMVLNGDLSLGFLVAFALYINRFFDPIRDMTQQYTNMQRATVAAERVFEILDWPQDVADAPGAIELNEIRGEVELRHVDFGYSEEIQVLHDLSLTIQPGEHVALVGQTGAGKSTIISLLARFYDVTGGALLVDGYDIRGVTMRSLRQQMGIVLQDPVIFSGTVRDNIAYGKPEATDEEIEAAAKAVGVHDLIMRLDRGYKTRVLPSGANLSLGQRQLISFARAMLVQPRILMLDEATAGIDTQTEVILQRGVAKLMEGRTAIVVAHRLSTIRDSDRIIVLKEGQIAEEGNHASLMQARGIYYDLYTMGFKDVAAGEEVVPIG
jgi:ABC-type multidrug transport system fused ATPase/permease subunit